MTLSSRCTFAKLWLMEKMSSACCWEIAIKSQLGSLKLPAKPDIFVAEQMALNAIQSLSIQASHTLHVFNLPHHHRDPFDHMIIAQAQFL